MKYVVVGLISLYALVLAFGMITGRVKVKSCCVIADPSKDLRINPNQDR